MAAAYVQTLVASYNDVGPSTEMVLSPLGKTVTVGNTIVVGVGSSIGGGLDVSGITDNLGNTYALANAADPIGSYQLAELWYAPVTTGGSITTITVTFDASSTYDYGIAVELSGVGTPTVGTDATGTGTPATWASSVTIPAHYAVIGLATLRSNATGAAGSASGSPSTSYTQVASAPSASWMAGYLSMAVAGESEVTGFTGTTTFTNDGASDEWGAVSAIFSAQAITSDPTTATATGSAKAIVPAIGAGVGWSTAVGVAYNATASTGTSTVPVWVSPADAAHHPPQPVLVFTMPSVGAAAHYWLELDGVDTFDSGSKVTYRSDQDQTGWQYWDGGTWQAIPAGGVASEYAGNQARLTVPSALADGIWYRRVRAGV